MSFTSFLSFPFNVFSSRLLLIFFLPFPLLRFFHSPVSPPLITTFTPLLPSYRFLLMSFLVAYCSSSSYHFLSFVSFTPLFLLLSLQLSLLLFSPLVSLLFSLSFSFLHFSIHIFLLPSPSLPISLLISPFLVSSFPPVLRDDNP